MTLWEGLNKPFWISIGIVIAIVVGLSSIYILKMGNDNPIEEAAEDFVEHVSGVKIDISEGEEITK